MKTKLNISIVLLFVALVGCTTIPTGPSVRVMPGPGKPFEQFQADDAVCREWARQQGGESPQNMVNKNTATGAVVGTGAGAALCAAIGSASGHAGTGAAIGAGSGLLVGTVAGASAGQSYGMEAQRRYDIAYEQCMAAKGNGVPGMQASPPVVVSAPPPPPPPPAPVVVPPLPPQPVFGAPPRFIYSPALGFYVAVETPYDLVFVDGQYFLWSNGYWYAAPYYSGPWAVVGVGRVPPPLHRFGWHEIRRHRDLEYREFRRNERHYRGHWYVPEERREHR
jgi:hypothetical protein